MFSEAENKKIWEINLENFSTSFQTFSTVFSQIHCYTEISSEITRKIL